MFFAKDIMNYFLYFPVNSNLPFFWNFGSFLIIILTIQIVTGILLSFLYTPSVNGFLILNETINENFLMMQLRNLHMNGAYLFFLILYMHIFRGIYFYSFKKKSAWLTGITIKLMLMAIAFLGYTLVWGTMSLWGSTVITSLVSVISEKIVLWLWGDFNVDSSTLSLFYSLHVFMPFLLALLIFFHLEFLHETVSTKMNNVNNMNYSFQMLFIVKDLLNLMPLVLFFFVITINPLMLGDAENYNMPNKLSSPTHIKPETYFLYAYAILRAIPNKMMGVLCLAFVIVMLFMFVLLNLVKKSNINSSFVWIFFFSFLVLTYLGGLAVESHYMMASIMTMNMFFFAWLIL